MLKLLMLKRLLPALMLTTSCAWGLAQTVPVRFNSYAIAQTTVPTTPTEEDSFYTFYDQQIDLIERSDQLAVKFTPVQQTRSSSSEISPFLQLQQDLQTDAETTRGPESSAAQVEVSPLGDQYALVKLSSGGSGFDAQLLQKLEQSYIETTLPVLSREDGEDSIVVTSEIVVSMEPGTSDSEARALLDRYNLEVVRPLQFSQGRYLVTAPNSGGRAVLTAANQLITVPTVQSATPNFIQALPYDVSPLNVLNADMGSGGLAEPPAPSESVKDSPFSNSLMPLQWYLNSESLKAQSGGDKAERTDIKALEAWEKSKGGENVVVAVIDSLIQWDHPDLANSLYRLPAGTANRLPGEVGGWDFSSTSPTCEGTVCVGGDPDTRVSDAEMAVLQPAFQRAIALSDEALLAAYSDIDEFLKEYMPELDLAGRAALLRSHIQNKVAGEFHGTWSAGIIAAQTSQQGMVGVAPRSQILPVRVTGLGGEITPAALIEAIGYAAARDADVVNFSLGGLLPNRDFTDQMFDVLDNNPEMVIVASAGNNNVDGVSFPAAIPGVLSVGATGLGGNRSFYSSYGAGLDVVAPGGETGNRKAEGMLTAGGTFLPAFWQGITQPETAWGPTLDPLGQYVQVQGTSFSAPVISGVMALMKGEDPNRELSREQLTEILSESASYDALTITQADANEYRIQASVGFGTVPTPFGTIPSRPSGIEGDVDPISAEEYFFGDGLVDAAAAVEAVVKSVAEGGQ